MGRYRVWQWGIEIGLGSHGQRKMSSRLVKRDFDTEREALEWAAAQDQSSWGTWAPCQCGANVVVECEFGELPESYRAAAQVGR